MKVLHVPDSRLREPTQPLTCVDQEVVDFVAQLAYTMGLERGVGIAAPQVGKPWRLFLVDGRVLGRVEPIVFINPELLLVSDEEDEMVEGCLSCPGLQKTVRRSKTVVCRARDLNFDVFEVDSNGLYARIIQHEYDHLQGKLLVDKE